MRLRLLAPILLLPALLPACSGGSNNNSGSGGGFGGGSTGTQSGSGAGGACMGGATDCGGKCVDTTSDANHCGACGVACGAGALCCDSACVETAGCSFAPTSVDPPTGFLNGGDYLTISGHGFTGPVVVHVGVGRAPARVIDPTKLLVQTPPGLLGKVDIKVALGGKTATLVKGFDYIKAGLMTPWQQKPLETVRGEDPGVAVMQDGRVLVAGGTQVPDSTADALDTAEIYTRKTDTVTPANGPMGTKRWQNSAVTLLDKRVLVVGAACHADLTACTGDGTLADLFVPGPDTFALTSAPLNVARAYPRAVMLGDGRVLISSANDPSLEVYDPDADSFKLIPATQSHIWGFMVRLQDGRALLGGGDGGVTAAEIFDPATDMLTSVGPMQQGRSMLTAHTLPDGRVMVIGGASMSAGGIVDPLDTVEYFDPKTGAFTLAPYHLSIGRCWHASALVRDGTVLVMGGYTVSGQCGSSVPSVDQIDPLAEAVMPFATLPNANTEWVAVTLLDGSVLGVGGGACGTSMALPDLDFLPGAPIPH
jgi:hypothetical protein